MFKFGIANKRIALIFLAALLSFTVVFYAADNNNGMSLANEIKEEAYITESDPYTALEGIEETRGADVKKEYKLNKVLDVAYGKVYKYKQYYKGAEVYGRELIVSADHNGKVLSVSGEYYKVGGIDESIKTEAEIEEQLRAQGITVKVTDKIVYTDGGAKYAYNAVCADNGLKYIVSALDGEILFSCPDDDSNSLLSKQKDADGNEVEINIEYSNKMYWLSDYTKNIYTINANYSTSGTGDYYANGSGSQFDPVAVSAYYNMSKAYDYYTDEKNIGVSRHGVNDGNDDIRGNDDMRPEEIPILIFVHFGREYENAGCTFDANNGVVMCIGDGKRGGIMYQPARALDIIAHEYQHAVTRFTSGFLYMNDSGALNEAFSDIFGMLIEGHDPAEDDFWYIGEDVVPNGYLRSIKGDTKTQRYYVKDKVPNCKLLHDHTDCDHGGVHSNSTIVSYVQYLLSKARPEFFTRERIGTLWFTTLCTLGSSATFDDFAKQFYQSAINLGYDDDICKVISDSLAEVGLIKTHTVTFVDESDYIIYQTKIIDGGNVNYPEVPQSKQNAQYFYEFTGWTGEAKNVTSDMVIKAEYKKTLRSYFAKFYDMDGNVLTQQEYDYGSNVEIPTISESPYPADKYNFEGWYLDEDFTIPLNDSSVIEGETSVYGKWTEIANEPEKDEPVKPDKNEETDNGGGGCGTIAFNDGGGGPLSGILLLSLACLAVVLLRKKKVFKE